MTTILLTGSTPDIPTNINTLERVIFHNALALQAAIGSATFNLDNGEGSQTLYCTINKGPVPTIGKQMVYVGIYLPLDSDIDSDAKNQRPWMYAEEISNNAYPVAFRAS